MKEHGVCIKFCFTTGRNAMGTYEMLCLLESGQLEATQVFVWFSKVKSGVRLLKMTSKANENVN
jgi:hypothetical protein